MIKRLSLLAVLCCLLLSTATAQQLGTWHLYLSYYTATQNVAADGMVYSLMNGNLLSYDTEDGEVVTYDNMGVLNGGTITYIAYCKEAKRLLIAYDDCNIDLLGKDGTVKNLPALKDKSMSDKEIKAVKMAGTTAYLVTGFGFVEVDMQEAVFRNTYRLPSFTINCITASDEAVFIGCSDAIRYCMKKDNMHLEDNWKTRLSGWGSWSFLDYYQGYLMGGKADGLYRLDTPTKNVSNTKYASGNIKFMHQDGDQLVWGNATQIGYTTDATQDPAILTKLGTWNDVTLANGTFWVSADEEGLMAYKLVEGELQAAAGPIQPSSPKNDLGYRVSWEGNRLLVAGGINTNDAIYYPATAMYYEDGKWTNFTELDVPAEYKNVKRQNTTDLVQDPKDPTHHFASQHYTGLYEYKDGKCILCYNCDNSPLKSASAASSWKYRTVTCAALSYDDDGNLWMANCMVDTVLHVLKPNGTWWSPYYENLEGCSLIDYIVHHSSGLKLLNIRRVEKRGIFCFDTKGTERMTDDRTVLIQTITNQDETPYTPDFFYCLSEDAYGNIWVGTSDGLFVMENLDQVFNQDYRFTQIKINRNDGSGLADYLLNTVSVACITHDAGGRHWIGTQNSGAYLISADGQEMLQHFTTDDSPLLSNTVQSIAVNPTTGEVVFGTDKGICSYIGDATEPKDELSKDNVVVFPNPVTSDYNGPIAIRGLSMNAEVKIVSTGGQLIWNGTSNGGTCTWDGCASNGLRVANGIYHVVSNDASGNTAVVTRIVIAR